MYLVGDPTLFDPVPELGMGYHLGRLEGEAAGGFVIVLNQEIAIEINKIGASAYLRKLARLISIANSSDGYQGRADALVRTISPSENVDGLIQVARPQGVGATRWQAMTHVHGSPPFARTTKPKDRFVRLTAFVKDRRVLSGGALAAGTYATSWSDVSAVPNAFCAVGRYALPNPVPPIHRFDITTHATARLLAGTCIPLFGQAGGGAEVEFNAGLPAGCVAYAGTITEL
ncbi:MAG: hypothetical protein H0T75_19685 [Rhizobiales bacterium]|nr:hypothetical protein [Hyphomicrobiales bacterium]